MHVVHCFYFLMLDYVRVTNFRIIIIIYMDHVSELKVMYDVMFTLAIHEGLSVS